MAPKEDSTAITFTEVDEVNHPTATYIYSEPAAGPAHREHGKKHGENWGRVDVAVSDDQCYPNPRTRLQSCRSNLTNCLLACFLHCSGSLVFKERSRLSS